MEYVMSREEQKMRKRWLVLTLCYFLIPAALLFVPVVVVLFSNTPFSIMVLLLLALPVLELIKLWIFWHCAYKKRGTALLTFCLVAGPLLVLLSLVGWLMGHRDPWTLEMLVIAVVVTPIYIWWYVLSFKLRKINRQFQVHKRLEASSSKS